MSRITFSLVFTFIITSVVSQNPPTLQWMNIIYDSVFPMGNRPLDISLVNDGIIYTASYAGSYKDVERGFFVRKYNTGGNMLWEYSDFGYQTDHYSALDAACDEEGNTYVSTDRNRIWKISSTGDSLWMKGASFNHDGVFYPEQLRYLDCKNNKIAGCGWYGLINYDEDGNFSELIYQEQKMRDPSYDGFGNTYFIGDYVEIIDHEHRIVKLDENHNKVWKMVLDPAPMDGIDVDIYGNIFLLSAYPDGSKLTKFDTDGDLLWKIDLPVNIYHEEPYNNSRIAESVHADREGNVFVAGDVSDTSGVTFSVCKFSSAGTLMWKFDWKDPDKSITSIHAADIINNGQDLYICGYRRTREGFRPPGFLMKLFDPDNFSGVKEEQANSNTWQLYPNPSNGHMFIHSQRESQSDKITFDLITITGACIPLPIQQHDAHTWSMDLSNIHEGCYFLRVKDGDNIAVKRILTFK